MRPADKLLDEVLQLPAEDRALLAFRLAESLHGEPEPDVESAWAEEISRRIQRLRDGTARVVPGAEALARARKEISARRA